LSRAATATAAAAARTAPTTEEKWGETPFFPPLTSYDF
jgi:hypothetical protein